MITYRLGLRLGTEHRRKLGELAAEHGVSVSEMVRRMIDKAHEESARARRRRAAQELGALEIEDVPDPATLSRQLATISPPDQSP